MAQKVFKWTAVVKRPLHVEELKEAVAFKPDDKSWNVDRIPHEDFMFESCRGLIIKDEDDETVHFAHHTVRQYLTGGLTTKEDSLFEISVENADILAGQTCVAYLSFSDFETQITTTTPTVTLEQKGVLESGGPLWIPSVLGIRRSMFVMPYRLLRVDQAVRPSGSDYWEHLRLKPKPKVSPSTDLKDKYRLLCYVIKHWEPHTRCYQLSIAESASEIRRCLNILAKHKTLAFEFRPWGPNQHFGPYGCVGCPSPSASSLVAKDLQSISMIHYAAAVGNLALLASSSSNGVSIDNYIDHERYNNETILIACRHNRVEVLKYILKLSNIDFSDGRAVNVAATAGHAETLQYLISLGQYSVEQQGDVALLLAAANGHVAVVEILAEAGANLNAYDQQTGRNAIESAAMNGHDSVIRTLLFQRPSHASHNLVTTALHLAAANGHTAATRALLDFDFPKDKIDSSGRTALHAAADAGHTAVARVLLQYSANPSITVHPAKSPDDDDNEKIPFHLAAKGGHVKILELLVTYLSRIDFRVPSSQQTALHLAAAGGHEKAIRWLVKNGADVEATDSSGKTPLELARELRRETAVRVLLKLGAQDIRIYTHGLSLQTLTLGPKHKQIATLRRLLDSLREDSHIPNWEQYRIIVQGLRNARSARIVAAIEMLEQELELLGARSTIDSFSLEPSTANTAK